MGNKQSDGTHHSFNNIKHDGTHSLSSPKDHTRGKRSGSLDNNSSIKTIAKKFIDEGDDLIKNAKSNEDYTIAKQKYVEALETLKDSVDENHHHHHSAALTNVGVIEFAEGRYDEAKRLLHEAVEKRRMLVHKDEFQPPNLSSLTIAYKKDRVFHRAPSTTIDMEASVLKNHGTVDAMTADLIGNLAVCHQKTGNLEEAKTLHEEALKLKKIIFGERSLPVADTLHYLAEVQDRLFNFPEAVGLLQEALSIEQQIYGMDDPKTIVALNNLGVMLVHEGKYEQAMPYLLQSYNIRKQVHGEDHHTTQVAFRNLEFCQNKVEEHTNRHTHQSQDAGKE